MLDDQIKTAVSPPLGDTVIQTQYNADVKNVEDFFGHKSPAFNFSSLKRLTLAELSYKGVFRNNRIFGFTRKQIMNIISYPERYGSQIVRLSNYMIRKSGYYKRLIEYFVNMGVVNWTVDTEVKSASFFKENTNTLRSNYIKFSAQCNKFKIDNRITDILRKLFIEDACFGFVTENDVDASIFFIDPKYCEIKRLVNGCVYQYAINRSLLTADYFESLPQELQEILIQSKELSKNNMVMIPYQNSFCLKYNTDFIYLYPPFFNLIEKILEIDDYGDLMKAKTESDAYKILYFKIPVTDDGQVAMGDEIVVPFVEMAKKIVPESFGVIPAPMDVALLESTSTTSDDTNKVEQAVENYYGEAGVSKALISSASSGSELKLSMKVDSSDIYRIYRQIEAWMDLQMKLRGYIYKSYQFVYRILPTTIFDLDDYVDRQLKLAQASIPNKGTLLAATGVNTAKMLGNTAMENTVLADVIATWQPLKSSYTTSETSGDEGGRPTLDETELAPSTDTQRENDSNSPDNRI